MASINGHMPFFHLSDKEFEILLGCDYNSDLINANVDLFNILPNPDKSEYYNNRNQFYYFKT